MFTKQEVVFNGYHSKTTLAKFAIYVDMNWEVTGRYQSIPAKLSGQVVAIEQHESEFDEPWS